MAKPFNPPCLPGMEEPPATEKHATRFTRHFGERFNALYGTKYPWRGRDFAHTRDILAAVSGDIDAACRIVDAYFSDRDKRYFGHELKWLYTDLARFVARAGQSRGMAGNGYRGSKAVTSQSRL